MKHSRDEHGLTKTERAVLELLVQGYTRPQIAEKLSMKETTIRIHLVAIDCAIVPLGYKWNEAQLIAYAKEHLMK